MERIPSTRKMERSLEELVNRQDFVPISLEVAKKMGENAVALSESFDGLALQVREYSDSLREVKGSLNVMIKEERETRNWLRWSSVVGIVILTGILVTLIYGSI